MQGLLFLLQFGCGDMRRTGDVLAVSSLAAFPLPAPWCLIQITFLCRRGKRANRLVRMSLAMCTVRREIGPEVRGTYLFAATYDAEIRGWCGVPMYLPLKAVFRLTKSKLDYISFSSGDRVDYRS